MCAQKNSTEASGPWTISGHDSTCSFILFSPFPICLSSFPLSSPTIIWHPPGCWLCSRILLFSSIQSILAIEVFRSILSPFPSSSVFYVSEYSWTKMVEVSSALSVSKRGSFLKLISVCHSDVQMFFFFRLQSHFFKGRLYKIPITRGNACVLRKVGSSESHSFNFPPPQWDEGRESSA